MGTLPARSSHQIQTKSDPDQKSNVTQPTTAGTSCDDGKGERKRHWIQKLQTSVCLLLVLVLLIHKPGGASPALIVFLCRTLTPTRVGPEQQIQNTSTQSPSATRQVQVTKPPSYSSHTHTHSHTHTLSHQMPAGVVYSDGTARGGETAAVRWVDSDASVVEDSVASSDAKNPGCSIPAEMDAVDGDKALSPGTSSSCSSPAMGAKACSAVVCGGNVPPHVREYAAS